MKAPYTGENALPLTPAQVEALHILDTANPKPFVVTNIHTAIALLNRGWIQKAAIGEQVSPNGLYYITQRGRTALKIGARK